jgi:lipopolysaccharide transport system permease protein
MNKYSSDYRKESNIFQVFKVLISQLFDYKWLIFLSIKKQLKLIYQQDLLSFFWMIVMPIVPMGAYVLLANIKIFNRVEDMPFVFYIVSGMFIWLLMSSIVSKVMLSVKRDSSILRTNNVSILISMVIKLGEILFDSFIRFISVVAVIIWFKIDVSISSLFFSFLALIPIIIVSFSLGVIFAVLDIILQDIRKFVDIFFRYGLFLSSVIFPFPLDGILGFINSFNIFNTFVIAFRDLLYFDHLSNPMLFLYTSIISVILFFIAMKVTYIYDYKIREYL